MKAALLELAAHLFQLHPFNLLIPQYFHDALAQYPRAEVVCQEI